MKQLRGACVYVWTRGEEVLYVGSGTSASRPLSHLHHAGSDFEPADEFLILPQPSVRAARELEALLIRQLRPTRNRQSASRLIDRAVARAMGYTRVSRINRYREATT